MELRFVILSVTCFACLIPPALSGNLPAVKAVAGQAAQDIASIGAKTLAAKKAAVVKAASDIASIAASGVALKGEALKNAAISMAGAMLNGAISVGATIAKAGINMVAAKFGAQPKLTVEPSFVLQKQELQDPVVVEYEPLVEVLMDHQMPPVSSVSVDVRSPSFSLPAAVPAIEVVGPANAPFIYEIVETPQVFNGPLIETFQLGK